MSDSDWISVACAAHPAPLKLMEIYETSVLLSVEEYFMDRGIFL